MSGIPQLPGYGELELVETFMYYDQPVLFSCKSLASEVHSCKDKIDRLFLAVAADETETTETWLYVVMSEGRLDDLKAGKFDLRTAFTEPEEKRLIELTIPFQDDDMARIRFVQPDEIDPEFLPASGEFLNDDD